MSLYEINNDEELYNLIKDNSKVIVDCYATWCGPCKVLSPIFESLAKENNEYVFVKANIELIEKFNKEFSIRAIPNVLVFNEGVMVKNKVGMLDAAKLKELLN